MRVAVTGGAGFIGHHLVRRLVEQGHDLVVLDNVRRGSFEREGLQGAECVEGDVRDFERCKLVFARCETVFHLAAQANVIGSDAEPDYAYSTNVTGTWNVLRAAGAVGVKHLVFASSREVYGDPSRIPVREDSPLAPKNLYGATKVAAEALLSTWGQATPSVSILRLANVVGAGDTGRVVPLWLEAARAGQPLRVFGGHQMLDLVPVDFVCSAMLAILERGPVSGPTNVGTGVSVPIVRLARHIIALVGSASEVELAPARAREVGRFCADTSRLSAELRLTPPTNPLESIEVSW